MSYGFLLLIPTIAGILITYFYFDLYGRARKSGKQRGAAITKGFLWLAVAAMYLFLAPITIAVIAPIYIQHAASPYEGGIYNALEAVRSVFGFVINLIAIYYFYRAMKEQN